MKRTMSLGVVAFLCWAGTACADEPVPLPACAAIAPCDYEFNCSSAPCAQSKFPPPQPSSTTSPTYSVDASTSANWLKPKRVEHTSPFQDPGVVDSLRYRVDDTLTLTGRLGGGYRRAHMDFGGAGIQGKKGLGTVFGVGVSYALSDRLTLNADIDHVSASRRTDGKPVTTISISAEYEF